MLELLAAIQSADPPSLVLWSLFVFAAGMYPIGFMLGSSCSPCCGQPCSACTTGSLPDTVTVTLSGYVDGQAQGNDLATLIFSSDFGSGAEGKVTAPGDTPGPITAVSVTNGGSGYARIARVSPSVTATASGGSGATLSVSLSQTTDNAWQYDGRAVWQVDSVAVTAGGTGYADGQAVTFNAGTGGTVLDGASAVIKTNRAQPTVTAAINSSTGSGATLGVTLTQTTDWNGDAVWSVSALSITAAGSGYQVGDQIQTAVTDGVQPYWDWFSAEVTAVDSSGAVTAVAIYSGGEYYKDGGVIQSVVVYSGGAYYKEDASAPAEVASVTIAVNQTGTGVNASGAVLAAVIDTNTASATFGQIMGITITNGGTGYLAWVYVNLKCCEDYYNGLTVVAKRQHNPPPGSGAFPCLYIGGACGTECGMTVFVEYFGPTTPPIVSVFASNSGGGPAYWFSGCNALMTSTTLVEDCDQFSFTATDSRGVTATVTAGGEIPDTQGLTSGQFSNCFPCCRGEEMPPAEVEVTVEIKSFFDEGDEWQPPTYMDEVPTVVLQRNVIPWGYSQGLCSGEWLGNMPNGYVAGVLIRACSDPICTGGHCWKECETRAFIQTIWNCYGFTNPDRGFSKSCENCADGPLCAPAAGQYIITKNVFGDGLCQLKAVRITVL